jgi:uncharacterized protein YkwD
LLGTGSFFRAATAVVVVFVVLGGVAVAQTDEPDLAAIDAALLNVSRTQSGLGALTVDPRLQAIAKHHAWGMAKHHVMKHNQHLVKEVSRSGLCWRLVGENIGWSRGPFPGQVKASTLHGAYMRSPLHRENILDPAYRLVGVGVVKSHGTIWNVEDFAAPC